MEVQQTGAPEAESALDEMQALFEALEEAEADLTSSNNSKKDFSQVGLQIFLII